MEQRAWHTLYYPDFCENDYIYHFTDISKAIKIIGGDSLRFSKISNTNDPLKSKPKSTSAIMTHSISPRIIT